MNIIFLGPPGAGKGTVAAELKKVVEFDHLSTGDMLRAEMKNGTELGLMAKDFIEKGQLVPDQVIIDMVKNRLDNATKSIVFDGFPRTVAQAEALDKVTKIDAVINLETTVDVVVKRICGRRICKECGKVFNTNWYSEATCDNCGGELYTRSDDNEETVKNRFEVYMKQTAPLVEYYNKQNIVHNIDANGEIVEKVNTIANILGSIK